MRLAAHPIRGYACGYQYGHKVTARIQQSRKRWLSRADLGAFRLYPVHNTLDPHVCIAVSEFQSTYAGARMIQLDFPQLACRYPGHASLCREARAGCSERVRTCALAVRLNTQPVTQITHTNTTRWAAGHVTVCASAFARRAGSRTSRHRLLLRSSLAPLA
jgi:hypothetical protein